MSPILEYLQMLLSRKDKTVSNHEKQRETQTNKKEQKTVYRSHKDGLHCKENSLLSGEDLSLSVTLYANDIEVCNPLGMSRQTDKRCAVYWVLR